MCVGRDRRPEVRGRSQWSPHPRPGLMNSQQNSVRFGAADRSILLRASACSGPLTPNPSPARGEGNNQDGAARNLIFAPLPRGQRGERCGAVSNIVNHHFRVDEPLRCSRFPTPDTGLQTPDFCRPRQRNGRRFRSSSRYVSDRLTDPLTAGSLAASYATDELRQPSYRAQPLPPTVRHKRRRFVI